MGYKIKHFLNSAIYGMNLRYFIPDYPRNTDIRAIFHGVMFLRISGFFFVFLYFERLYIFQDLNLEQTLPSIRKRDLPGAGIDPTTFRLISQNAANELSKLDGVTGVTISCKATHENMFQDIFSCLN